MGIERGVEQTLDAGQVEAAVFRVRMVAIDRQCEERQGADQKQSEAALLPWAGDGR